MKNRNKRFTSVLAASMALGMMAPAMVSVAPVFAEEPVTVDSVEYQGFKYDIYKNVNQTVVGADTYTATLVAPLNMAADFSTLVIPSSIDVSVNEENAENVKVTAIAPNAFAGCTTLRNLTINSNIKTVGTSAFANTSLVNVTVNGADITNQAFFGNKDLASVTLNDVESLGQQAFANCPYLTNLSLGDALETIGVAAFANDAGLKAVTLPDSVVTINEDAFSGTNVTGKIQLPADLVTVGKNAFATQASSLKLVLPEEPNKRLAWNAPVFGEAVNSANPDAIKSYQIIGVGAYEDCGVNLNEDEPFYVATPYIKMSSKNANNTPIYSNNQDMQVVLGKSVKIYTFEAGTLTIDGATEATYTTVPTNQTNALPAQFKTVPNLSPFTYNLFEYKTPQVGKHTITFTPASGGEASTLEIYVVANGNNYWIQENFTIPTNWTVGSDAKPEGAKSAYGTVEYVYSTTKGGTFTENLPTTPGWYWVKAIVKPVEGEYNGLETDPVQFELFAAGEFGGWVKSGNNWMYYNEDGEAVKDTMMEIDGDLYMFDANGIMQTGWQNTDAGWMFFDNAGHAKKGWLNDEGTWYYFGEDHIMVKSTWVEDAGKQYYLTSSGAMAASRWLTKDGHDVYVDNSGALKTGWLAYNMNWYYLEPSTGYMATSGTVDGWNIQSNGIAVKA